MSPAGPSLVNIVIATIIGFIAVGLAAAVRRHEPNPVIARVLMIAVYLTSALAILMRLQ
jgi:hypothetical protein